MSQVAAIRPLTLFSADQWRALTAVSRWRGAWLIVHAWLVIATVAGGTAWLWQWHWWAGLAATPFALAILGGRQLGLAILMHDAAHGLTHPNRRLNNWLGQWPAGAAVGSDLKSYRAYHLTHHRYTQQDEDPDLGLSAPFPTTRASLMRKVVRDLTGQTFVKQRRAQFGLAWLGLRALLAGHGANSAARRDTTAGTPFNATGPLASPAQSSASARVAPPPAVSIPVAQAVGRFLTVQAMILTLSLFTVGWVAFTLWLTALATTFQLFLRVRNIAEHACTATGAGDPFSHARTTRANVFERATVAPYWVNYHIEHHLFMGVPCYSLPAAHAALVGGGHGDRMMIAPGYTSVLSTVTRKNVTAS